jgi:hypothetical protein
VIYKTEEETMFKFSLLFAIVLGLSGGMAAQTAVDQKTRDLVASLDKTKYKKKEKANISIELYVDVKNEAALLGSPSEYSGTYVSEANDFRLDLHAGKDGRATGGGYDTLPETGNRVNYLLKEARLQGALLTATKVYDDGRSVPFEAVFVNRTSKAGTRPDVITATETKFGIGWIEKSGEMQMRVFLERK